MNTIRALLRGLLSQDADLEAHKVLVKDFNSVVINGLNARTMHPHGRTGRGVCQALFEIALRNATEEEKKSLSLVKRRIDNGSLSDAAWKNVERKTQKNRLQRSSYQCLLKTCQKPYGQSALLLTQKRRT